jgi:hypothetical protein
LEGGGKVHQETFEKDKQAENQEMGNESQLKR